MADSAPQQGGLNISGVTGTLKAMAMRSDLMLAFGVIATLVILILPMPPLLLDMALALSITFSVLVMMTAIFIEKPVEFTSFPLVLLIATMYRLSLNLASTRLILAKGHEGTDAAGNVIKAFGSFIMGGNFIIGVIVFAILVLVNFMVITKGSGRIAEVAARFALDALPGKQMAIDADLSTGLIDEPTARKRREDLQQESSFYGAMDGASKFVRGDAIAGLIITAINIIAGMIIGMLQNNMDFMEAADAYTRLTVGDGLVSQIPALTISISAGIMVSKAGLNESTETVLFGQLASYPKALGMSSMMAASLAILPGTPALPFLALSLMSGAAAYHLDKKAKEKAIADKIRAQQEQVEAKTTEAELPISASLKMDLVRLELGYALLALINDDDNRRLTDQIKALRRAMAQEMGFIMPAVRIQDNMQMEPNAYRIFIKEIETGGGELRPNRLLTMDPRGEEMTLSGEKTTEPTFGLPALWIDQSYREEALFRGYTVVDPPTVVTTHITEIIREHMPELLSFSETQKLLDDLDKADQKLVGELVPNRISIGGIQRVLQNLLQERVSIRDLPSILEGISEASSTTSNIMMITEHVRGRLARQLCNSNVDHEGVLTMVTLSPTWEQTFAEALVGAGDEKQLSMPPSRLQEFITRVRQAFEDFAQQGATPVLLCSPGIRPYVRAIIDRFRPVTVVMSQNEIHPRAKIRTIGQI